MARNHSDDFGPDAPSMPGVDWPEPTPRPRMIHVGAYERRAPVRRPTEEATVTPTPPRRRRPPRATSLAAHESITWDQLRDRQRAVLWVVWLLTHHAYDHGVTDEDIAGAYDHQSIHGKAPVQSPSGLRTRRSELVEKLLLEEVGRGTTRSGRACARWALTPKGRELAATAVDRV